MERLEAGMRRGLRQEPSNRRGEARTEDDEGCGSVLVSPHPPFIHLPRRAVSYSLVPHSFLPSLLRRGLRRVNGERSETRPDGGTVRDRAVYGE